MAILAGDAQSIRAVTQDTQEPVVRKWLEEGNTPLNILVGHGATAEVIKECIIAGADPCQPVSETAGSWTPLHSAAFHNRVDVLMFMVQRGADVRLRAGARSLTPLHAAVMGEAKDAVEFFFTVGVEVNLPDSKGETPLDYAERNLRLFTRPRTRELVTLLLRRGGSRKSAQ